MGRDYVVPEDVKLLAPAVISHRLILSGVSGTEAERRVMERILNGVSVPVEDWKRR